MGQWPSLEIGVDLLDAGVPAVLVFGGSRVIGLSVKQAW